MQVGKLLGSNPLVKNAAYTCDFINSTFTQSLRFRHIRKPMWLGTAKTKMFRVPKKPVIPKDEFQEIQRLYNHYRTYLRSTLKYFEQITRQNEVQLDPAVIEKAEIEDFEKCCQINDEWNKQVAAEREMRMVEIEKEQLQKAELCKQENLMKKQECLIKADERVKKLKSMSDTLITRKNIDQAIEDALADVVNYNKALITDGEWYTEPTGIPPPKIPASKGSKAVQAQQ